MREWRRRPNAAVDLELPLSTKSKYIRLTTTKNVENIRMKMLVVSNKFTRLLSLSAFLDLSWLDLSGVKCNIVSNQSPGPCQKPSLGKLQHSIKYPRLPSTSELGRDSCLCWRYFMMLIWSYFALSHEAWLLPGEEIVGKISQIA